jgi:hypothetical protein
MKYTNQILLYILIFSNYANCLNDTNLNETSHLEFQQKLETIRNLIFLYYLPTIVIIGIIGNTLTIIIISKEKSLLKLHDPTKSLRENFNELKANNTNLLNVPNSVSKQTKRKLFIPKKVTNQFSSSNYFIFCLAVSDLVYNFILLLVWISRVGFNIVHLKYVCQITIAISYICSFLSAAFTTLFTFQRFMAVSKPLKAATSFSLQSPYFIKLIIVCLVISSCFVYSFSLFLYDSEPKKEHEHIKEASSICGPKESQKNLVLIINNTLDTLLTLIIPSFGIICMNVAICKSFRKYSNENDINLSTTDGIALNTNKIIKSKSNYSLNSLIVDEKVNMNRSFKMKQATNTNELDIPMKVIKTTKSKSLSLNSNLKKNINIVSNNGNNSNNNNNQCSSRHVTKTLLIVSFAFILLNSPFRASQLIVNIRMFLSKNYVYSNFEYVINELLLNLYFTSYSVNFFLYSLCGKKFRESLKALILYCTFFIYSKIICLFTRHS